MVFVTWHMDRPLPGPGPYAHEKMSKLGWFAWEHFSCLPDAVHD